MSAPREGEGDQSEADSCEQGGGGSSSKTDQLF